jgi:predicted anti-sigma-YlaC factor YlaD
LKSIIARVPRVARRLATLGFVAESLWDSFHPHELWLSLSLVLLCLFNSGCSIRHYAMNKVADGLSQTGTAFSSDDDPELIKNAAPFSLKLMETVLAENPKHPGLLTAATSGFTQYAFAFVQEEADELESTDFEAAEALRKRALRLYQRAHRYGMRGLETKHPNFSENLLRDPKKTVLQAGKKEVPLLYWTAAAWGSIISLSKDNPKLVGQIPAMEALIDRALALDESYANGSIHTFLITYEMSRARASGDPAQRARKHFERAMQLSNGKDASPLVALAEAVTIQIQDENEFESLLNRALAIDPDAHPDNRLVNLVMQRRARWLLSRKSELFLSK